MEIEDADAFCVECLHLCGHRLDVARAVARPAAQAVPGGDGAERAGMLAAARLEHADHRQSEVVVGREAADRPGQAIEIGRKAGWRVSRDYAGRVAPDQAGHACRIAPVGGEIAHDGLAFTASDRVDRRHLAKQCLSVEGSEVTAGDDMPTEAQSSRALRQCDELTRTRREHHRQPRDLRATLRQLLRRLLKVSRMVEIDLHDLVTGVFKRATDVAKRKVLLKFRADQGNAHPRIQPQAAIAGVTFYVQSKRRFGSRPCSRGFAADPGRLQAEAAFSRSPLRLRHRRRQVPD